eukprot:CAMPEP_0170548856 /NCGR_PEP_ID=MMETSP0211-20121228/7036_1 /TAXON_ID=311385 /ORGANISM="Pseudokeronopsis sp., Strain OXSARD2" /LENGTH=49 /DNA_ID= /DNA_START= /DNA_END= /DNA_ORIENTATION=
MSRFLLSPAYASSTTLSKLFSPVSKFPNPSSVPPPIIDPITLLNEPKSS